MQYVSGFVQSLCHDNRSVCIHSGRSQVQPFQARVYSESGFQCNDLGHPLPSVSSLCNAAISEYLLHLTLVHSRGSDRDPGFLTWCSISEMVLVRQAHVENTASMLTSACASVCRPAASILLSPRFSTLSVLFRFKTCAMYDTPPCTKHGEQLTVLRTAMHSLGSRCP